MSTSVKEYAYYIRGNKIALVQRDNTSVQNGQTVTAPDLDLPRGAGLFKSPVEDVTDGLQIEYTYSIADQINDEGDDIDLEPYLVKALICYVKAKFALDAGNIELKEYMMREFRKMVEKHNNANVWGPRRKMPGPNAIK